MTARGGGDRAAELRPDLLIVADMVKPGSRVLDVGCGDGMLLDYLTRRKRVDGRGIELSQAGVNACVSQGLSVIQGDADKDLRDYPGDAFDYVILSQTLQATHNPKGVLLQMLRIGRRAVVSFPNYAYWRARWYLLVRGRMPVTKLLREPWYTTSTIHPCTIVDFVVLCRDLDVTIERCFALDHEGRARSIRGGDSFANLFGEQAVFLLSKN